MNKDKVIRLRVSKEEYLLYKLAAKRNNMTLSALIRSFLLTGFPNNNEEVTIKIAVNSFGNIITKGKKAYKPNLEKKY